MKIMKYYRVGIEETVLCYDRKRHSLYMTYSVRYYNFGKTIYTMSNESNGII